MSTILACTSLSTYAGTVVCSGKVDKVAYHGNNKLMVKLDSMNKPVFFCNPEAEWTVSGTSYKTGPETCKVMYSTFLAALMSDKTIHALYFDGDDVPATCAEWGDWKNASLRHYSLSK